MLTKLRNTLLLMLMLGLSACGGPPKNLKSFASLANEPVIAGVGWGDLILGESTLADVLKTLIAALLSEESTVELSYGGGQIQLNFALDQEQSDKVNKQQPGWYKTLVKDPDSIQQMPDILQEATLHSLSLAPGHNAASTLFKGQSEHGLGFWQGLQITDAFFEDNPLDFENGCCRTPGHLAGWPAVDKQKLVPLSPWFKPGLLAYTAPENASIAQAVEGAVQKYLNSEQSASDQASLQAEVKALGQESHLARLIIFEPRSPEALEAS
jgi:hypothetical protein